MNPSRHPIRQQILRLQSDAHQAVRRYFEKHEAAIRQLDQDEFFDIMVIYLDALFECGEYELFLERVDEGIAMAVDRHDFSPREEDLFHYFLYRKAAASFHMGKEDQCVHVLTELLKLDPSHELAPRFLIKCGIRSRRTIRQSFRAWSIGLFLSTVVVLVLETLWIRPFAGAWVRDVMLIRNLLFLAGWSVLLGGEAWLYLTSSHEVVRLRRSLPRRRRNKEKQAELWH